MAVQMGWDLTFWSSSHLEEIVSLFTGDSCYQVAKKSLKIPVRGKDHFNSCELWVYVRTEKKVKQEFRINCISPF